MSFDPKVCAYEAPLLRCRVDALDAGESKTFLAAIYVPKEKTTIKATVKNRDLIIHLLLDSGQPCCGQTG